MRLGYETFDGAFIRSGRPLCDTGIAPDVTVLVYETPNN